MCDKKAYNSFKEAQTVVNRAKHPRKHGRGRKGGMRRHRKDKIPVRSYLCPECGMYHLTSKKKNKHND